jgi:hypothetical protein
MEDGRQQDQRQDGQWHERSLASTPWRQSLWANADILDIRYGAKDSAQTGETGRAAVAKVAIRDKENLCLVRPYQDVLTMETMLYANEIRSTQDIAVDGAEVSPRELQMAISLIENLSDRFRPQRLPRRVPGRTEAAHRCQGRGRTPADSVIRARRESTRPDGRPSRQCRGDQEEVIGPSP